VVELDRLDDVIGAVSRAGARGMTVCEVRGFGRQFGRQDMDWSADAGVLVLPKLRVDVLTADERAEPLAVAVAEAVSTGVAGDGKIWISPVEGVLRVRTGERDAEAV
jgi:nitrogen regulatory protein P-II 1